MKLEWRSAVPSWRARRDRPLRLGGVLVAAVLLSMMLVEVWQGATVKTLSVRLDERTRALQQASANLEYTRAQLQRESTRAELLPMAARLGLAPVDPSQIVALPSDYLAADAAGPDADGASILAWAGRGLASLVPEASARGTRVN